MMNILQEERGGVLVLICLAMTVLIGLAAIAVDIGNLYAVRSRLVNTADSAALAGVALLPNDPKGSREVARDYIEKNRANVDHAEISISASNKEISVVVNEQIPYNFARVLGFTSQLVSARAVAQVSSVCSAVGVVPFGIEKQNFVFGQLYRLKEGAGNGYDGNYRALALGGSGSSNYKSNIIYGYNGSLQVGDWVDNETGNMAGPTSTGVNTRINNDTDNCSYNNHTKDCPRVVTVPIIDSLEVNGRSEVEIVGFARFFLAGVGGNGQENYVKGRFLEELADSPGNTDTQYYGLRSTKLVQ